MLYTRCAVRVTIIRGSMASILHLCEGNSTHSASIRRNCKGRAFHVVGRAKYPTSSEDAKDLCNMQNPAPSVLSLWYL